MTLPLRIVCTVCLAGTLFFCIFGFLATFEPGDRSTMITYRLIYGSVGTAITIGLGALWKNASKRNG